MRKWGSDPEAPWWVKLRRARVHIDEVRRCADALQHSEAWSIQREPAECAEGWVFRFKILQGDPCRSVSGGGRCSRQHAVSALDYVAYELALCHVGEELSEEQEAATAFPICIDDAAFQRFFTQGRHGRVRSVLYGDAERKALQASSRTLLAMKPALWVSSGRQHPKRNCLQIMPMR